MLLVWRQQLRHWHVVAQRSELLSLQHQAVEMAQGKQNRPRSKFGICHVQETCDPEIPWSSVNCRIKCKPCHLKLKKSKCFKTKNVQRMRSQVLWLDLAIALIKLFSIKKCEGSPFSAMKNWKTLFTEISKHFFCLQRRYLDDASLGISILSKSILVSLSTFDSYHYITIILYYLYIQEMMIGVDSIWIKLCLISGIFRSSSWPKGLAVAHSSAWWISPRDQSEYRACEMTETTYETRRRIIG